jgi:hypothetical protein
LQLVSWNIDISRGCDNLELLVGNQICVTFPGDSTAVTATAPAATNSPAPIPDNVVIGTNTKCGKFYEVRAGDDCADVTNIAGIALSEFYFLNPEINSTCGNLLLGLSYCVQAVGDISTYPGYGSNPTNPCVGGTTVGPASCYATTYSTAEVWTFPAINATTTVAENFTSIPVTPITAFPFTGTPAPTPSPFQASMLPGCTQFYFVMSKSMVVSILAACANTYQSGGDGCFDIAQRYSISVDDLDAWNPDLKADCSGL